MEVQEIESIGEGNPATCVGYALLDFDAQMATHEFISGNYEDLEWYDGEIDDPYITVHTTMRVQVEAQIEFDLEAQTAWVDGSSFDWA